MMVSEDGSLYLYALLATNWQYSLSSIYVSWRENAIRGRRDGDRIGVSAHAGLSPRALKTGATGTFQQYVDKNTE